MRKVQLPRFRVGEKVVVRVGRVGPGDRLVDAPDVAPVGGEGQYDAQAALGRLGQGVVQAFKGGLGVGALLGRNVS